uniref:Uncharacterized protein n=1 Tax=Phlebotomus papatasi TaxID=29031 RepID=A0A1B0D4B5_PHLPP
MKTLIVLVVLTAICGSQAAITSRIFPLIAPRDLIGPPAGDDPATICGGAFGEKCKDCFSMLICLGNNPPSEAKCPDATPYCDKTRPSGVCVKDKPAGDPTCEGPPPTGFICTAAEGFFPHPTNCSQYFECLNNEAIKYDCPPGYSWTTNGMGCRQRTSTIHCGTITCKAGDVTAPLSNNATFFGYCNIAEALENIIVTKCPGARQVYDTSLKACNFVCPSEGLFEDDIDPTFYYECYKSGTKIVYESKQCSNNRTFNERERRCVAADQGQTPVLVL